MELNTNIILTHTQSHIKTFHIGHKTLKVLHDYTKNIDHT